MEIRRHLLTAAIVAAAIGPAASFASSELHRVDGEIGYTQHPDYVKPSKLTRAQVLADVGSERMQGGGQRDVSSKPKQVGPSKTRDQVINEMRTRSDRRARTGIYWGGE